MEWETGKKHGAFYSSSGMDISKRSHNHKQMMKAEKRWQEKLEWEEMKKLKKLEHEYEMEQ